MKKIKIVIVGLGGVGGYYGGLLAKKYVESPEIEIYFVARGAHLKKIQEDGLTVITESGTFVTRPPLATDNVSEIGKADYVIITTKSYDLEATIEQLKPCLKEDTVILPLLNGVDISHRIRKVVSGIEVWNGCCYIVGRLNQPGVVESSGGIHDLFFGHENQTSERLLWLEKVLKDAGIPAVFSKNIRKIIWRKFIFISTTATLTSYFNVGFRDLLTDNQRRETTIAFMKEVASVANAEGIVFEKDIIETTIRHIEKLPFGTTSSMHTDFQSGRNTELNTLTKIVIDLGKKNGIPTPIYEKVFEELNLIGSI
jgi:2-dehydropantoate 2-reductase